MRLHKLLSMAVLLCCTIARGDGQPEDHNQPNILLIVADDLGWRDVSWHGGQFQTPVLDRLVKEGVELDRHYVQPVCSPTRTALLSGRWTSRFGPHAMSPTNRRVFPPGTMTLAGALQQAGYSTHIAGKWHLGSRPEWGPNHYGFDRSYGSLNGAVDPWTHLYREGPYLETWHRDGNIIQEEGNATELVASQVEQWIRAARSPWFIYVPFHAVHIPIDAPEQFQKLYADAALDPDPVRNDSLKRFGAFVTQLDTKVGQFIRAIDESGVRSRTLIVFTSDNGGLAQGGNPYVGKVPPTPALSSNLPLRGFKNQLYEGGIRVPAFVNWPGRLKPGRLSAPMHVADWMPTLTSLVGWKKPADLHFDGLNQWPVLTGEVASPEPRTIYIPHPSGSVILHDGWKLISRTGDQPAELFHVVDDPTEKTNLENVHPDRVRQLEEMLKTLQQDDLQKVPADLVGIPN